MWSKKQSFMLLLSPVYVLALPQKFWVVVRKMSNDGPGKI